MNESRSQRPTVSIIVEGYNESRDLGEADNTVEALRQQDFPIDRVEIVLMGSAEQVRAWEARYADDTTFWKIRAVAVEGLSYLQVKNRGAQFSSGDILAFTDSDVFPHRTWLASLVDGLRDGDVSVGLSLFKSSTSWRWNRPTRLVAASITWGWIVGNEFDSKRGVFSPVGFMDHNFAMRAETFRRFHYGTEFGRLCGAPTLTQALLDGGQTLVLQPLQRVTHYFAWFYWLKCLHFRYGYEVYVMRRKLHRFPNKWIAKTRFIEPLVTMVWHILLDVPRWFRVSPLMDVPAFRRVALLPLVVAMSCVARTAEMVGMYCTMLDADRMERWAESV
jgi:glycosyltransferase involved in cell wall biosynthesis